MNSDRIVDRLRLLAVAAATLGLGACASTHSASTGAIDPADFGEANRQTYAAMIIDPDPNYSEPMRTSAEHAADAAERYREGEVKEPESVRSTEGVSE
jgi:ABC-type sugar transport system substrate-binding protein